ncbi:MAG: glycosyltransferase family 2 protein [Vampirovibrionales bacterium]|nr:glycosyltransferase family 2 protein [Vampirovibrionales bacterium]
MIPLYNERDTLPELTRRLDRVIAKTPQYAWQVLLVNDGSADGSDLLLGRLATRYPWLTALHLSRNFGHQIAISAGIDHARGDAVIVMDGDLQDPPELLPQMLAQWEDGYDVVYATRRRREGETPFKRATAKVFYRLMRRLSDIDIPLDTGDFRLMSRPVTDAFCAMREKNRFVRGMVSWVGFRQTALYYERDPRFTGETKYTLLKMMRFALDGLLSFSKAPLQWIMSLGFAMSLASFAAVAYVLYVTLIAGHGVPGWGSLMAGVLLIGGIQLICLGMIGEYVGRIFDEVRHRPLYLIGRVEGAPVRQAPLRLDAFQAPPALASSLVESKTPSLIIPEPPPDARRDRLLL